MKTWVQILIHIQDYTQDRLRVTCLEPQHQYMQWHMCPRGLLASKKRSVHISEEDSVLPPPHITHANQTEKSSNRFWKYCPTPSTLIFSILSHKIFPKNLWFDARYRSDPKGLFTVHFMSWKGGGTGRAEFISSSPVMRTKSLSLETCNPLWYCLIVFRVQSRIGMVLSF